jgi:hypothetical protein
MTIVAKGFTNGHYYQFNPSYTSLAPGWDNVPYPHTTLPQLGNQQGCLATVTSSDENAFIASFTTGKAWLSGSPWSGATPTSTGTTVANNFRWYEPNAPEYNFYFRQNGQRWLAGAAGMVVSSPASLQPDSPPVPLLPQTPEAHP